MSTPPATAYHVHDPGLDAPLDLINTLELTDGKPDDQLATADAAVGFFAGHDLAHEEDLRSQARREGDAWLDRIRRRGPRSASYGTLRSRAARRTDMPCGRSTRSSKVAPGWSSGRRSRASRWPIVIATTTRRARRWRARQRRSSRRSRRARACVSGSARTTAVAGCSRTPRARDDAAGAIWRPAATARRRGAFARGTVTQAVAPRVPARLPPTPSPSRAAA